MAEGRATHDQDPRYQSRGSALHATSGGRRRKRAIGDDPGATRRKFVAAGVSAAAAGYRAVRATTRTARGTTDRRRCPGRISRSPDDAGHGHARTPFAGRPRRCGGYPGRHGRGGGHPSTAWNADRRRYQGAIPIPDGAATRATEETRVRYRYLRGGSKGGAAGDDLGAKPRARL